MQSHSLWYRWFGMQKKEKAPGNKTQWIWCLLFELMEHCIEWPCASAVISLSWVFFLAFYHILIYCDVKAWSKGCLTDSSRGQEQPSVNTERAAVGWAGGVDMVKPRLDLILLFFFFFRPVPSPSLQCSRKACLRLHLHSSSCFRTENSHSLSMFIFNR